jgi:hypothetical protein
MSKLSDRQMEKLDRLGFLWPTGDAWEDMFAQLESFHRQHSHANVRTDKAPAMNSLFLGATFSLTLYDMLRSLDRSLIDTRKTPSWLDGSTDRESITRRFRTERILH